MRSLPSAAAPRAMLAAALLVPAPARAEPPPLPAAERVLLSEAFRLSEELGEEIWPGWTLAPWEVLLVAGEHEYLVNSPRRPEGFEPLGRGELIPGELQVRPRTVAPDLRATYPILGGPPVVVIGRPRATGLDPAAWIAILLHEHFHQLQMSHPTYYDEVEALDLAGNDETGMWMLNFDFPYDDPEVGRRFDELCLAIRAAIEGGAPALWVREAMAGLARALTPEAYRYLSFQLWQEGVARYVQYRAARLAGERFRPSPAMRALPGFRPFDELAAELRAGILAELAEPELAARRRVAFYAAGAGLAMLLEETAPGWRDGYLGIGFSLEALLGR